MPKRRSKQRSKTRAPAPRGKKQKRSPPAKPKKQKRSPKKKRSSAAVKRGRSQAAKKGWRKRKKKQRLIEAMADIRLRRTDQPIGWLQRRATLRTLHRGKTWRQTFLSFDPEARERVRLAELQRLQIDFLTRDELYDYLSWMAEELEIDISDMYRMYLGYDVGEVAAE